MDILLQSMRIQKAKQFFPSNAYVLDIGCSDGELFKQLKGQIQGGIGIDPLLNQKIIEDQYQLLPGWFPDGLQAEECSFDVITALAVVEHIPVTRQDAFARACFRYLKPGGRLIFSIPSPLVDRILDIFLRLRLVDGMSLEEHYGFDSRSVLDTYRLWNFDLQVHQKFELGLNHIYVFSKPFANILEQKQESSVSLEI
jgi:SAM-dependent methyltransferase